MGSERDTWRGPEILGVREHAALDELAGLNGISIEVLMENAGRQTANIIEQWNTNGRSVPITILCGPGNNGGDGFVAAQHLSARGYRVEVLTVGDGSRASAAALAARAGWRGPVRPWESGERPGPGIVVDAVFGAGLTRAIDPALAHYFRQAMRSVAIDVPSGLHGDTAKFLGEEAWTAGLTVSFMRYKPAHVLMPGAKYCGKVTLCDIGMPPDLIAALAEAAGEGAIEGAVFALENESPILTLTPDVDGHKYDRGHCVVAAGPALNTGAARLAARAALRTGAGLVTLLAEPDAALVCAHHVTAEMVTSFDGDAGFRAVLNDPRKNAVVVGPGLDLGTQNWGIVAAILAGPAGVVLDAGALTAFASSPKTLFDMIKAKPGAGVVLTPHDGEFERLFPALRKRAVNKIEAARIASDQCGAVVVLKGADTVIAAPDGRARVNTNAPPWLATAGSGDVLAGVIGGLLAQRHPAFEAASAGVWLHGAAGAALGPGLIASDLPEVLPKVLKNIATHPKNAL